MREVVAVQAQSRASQRRKAATQAPHRDSEQSFSKKGFIPLATLLWPEAAFFQMLLSVCVFLGAGLRLPRPLRSRSLCGSPASTHLGLFPPADRCLHPSLPGQRQDQVQSFAGVPPEPRSSGSHRPWRQRSAPPTHQSQLAGFEQLEQEIGNEIGTIRWRPPPTSNAFTPSFSFTPMQAYPGHKSALTHTCTHIHMRIGTRYPHPTDTQTHAEMARKCTHMLSLDTNLAGELATTWGGEKGQRRQRHQNEAPAGGARTLGPAAHWPC